MPGMFHFFSIQEFHPLSFCCDNFIVPSYFYLYSFMIRLMSIKLLPFYPNAILFYSLSDNNIYVRIIICRTSISCSFLTFVEFSSLCFPIYLPSCILRCSNIFINVYIYYFWVFILFFYIIHEIFNFPPFILRHTCFCMKGSYYSLFLFTSMYYL